MGVAFHHNGGGDSDHPFGLHAVFALATAGLFFKLVDHHGGGVGQLIAREAKEFFTHGFTGQKLFAAVGELVFGITPRLLGQVLLANDQEAFNVFGVFGRHRHKLGEGVTLLHVLQPGRNVGAAGHLVELVGYQQCGNILAPTSPDEGQHLGVGLVEHARLHHKQNQVYISDRALHGFVERAVQRIVVAGLKARRIDKHKLRGTHGVHAGDAVARGLRLARGDADLLAHQRIEQGGFAHIGLADNGNQAAALAFNRRAGRRAGRGCQFCLFQHALNHSFKVILAKPQVQA